jgi:anti-sigma factor RsiW
MTDHLSDDVLLALADDEPIHGDAEAVSRHVSSCSRCRDIVAALRGVRLAVTAQSRKSESVSEPSTWPALAERITARRSRRIAGMQAAALLTAALVVVAVSLSRKWTQSSQIDADAARLAAPNAATLFDTATATLQRALLARRPHLSSTQRQAIDAVASGLELAIQQTRGELAKDPGNPFLLDHLTELRRKQIEALADFIVLAPDRG